MNTFFHSYWLLLGHYRDVWTLESISNVYDKLIFIYTTTHAKSITLYNNSTESPQVGGICRSTLWSKAESGSVT